MEFETVLKELIELGKKNGFVTTKDIVKYFSVDSDEYDPHYFLYFNFDSDGNFVNAQLQVNLFRDNEINITESIVSMDPEIVNTEILKEYQRAVG